MCNACGFPARPGHWTDAGLTTPHDRIRARFTRAALLQRVLKPYGLTAHDDGLTGLRLATLSGASIMVDGLDDLWTKAATLAGRPIDVL